MENDSLKVLSWRYTKARIHIESDSAFINDIILNRDFNKYPDPYIRVLEDKKLLSDYLTRVIIAIRNYTPENDEEKEIIEDFFNREQERVNKQLGEIKTLHPTEHGISKEIVETLENNKLNTGYGLSFQRIIPWDAYEVLYNDLSIRDLRILSIHFKLKPSINDWNEQNINTRIINAIRYIRGDSTISLENIISFVPLKKVKENITVEVDGEPIELEEGVPFDTIKNNLKETIRKFSTLETALALANIEKITNYHNPCLSNGHYKDGQININSPLQKTEETDRNIVAHEFFHSVQDITATRTLKTQKTASASKYKEEKDNRDEIVYPETYRYMETQKKVKQLWFKFQDGNIPKLCEYQTKNIDEMYSVAFESFIENPQILQKRQPEVYRHLENLLN